MSVADAILSARTLEVAGKVRERLWRLALARGELEQAQAQAQSALQTALGIDKQAHIIFMRRSGSTRSAPAADTLFAMGYPNVYSMVDGFEGGKSSDGLRKRARDRRLE